MNEHDNQHPQPPTTPTKQNRQNRQNERNRQNGQARTALADAVATLRAHSVDFEAIAMKQASVAMRSGGHGSVTVAPVPINVGTCPEEEGNIIEKHLESQTHEQGKENE